MDVDILEKKIRDLEFQIKKYHDALENAGLDFFDINFNSGEATQSENIIKRLGYEENEVDTFEKRNATFHPDDLKESLIHVDKLRKGEINRTDLLFRVFSKLGQTYWLKHDGILINNPYNNESHFVGILKDVTNEKELLEELSHLASYDTLTNTYNRRSGLKMLQRELDSLEDVNISYIDVDDFKRFNDTYGHETGDKVLKCICKSFIDNLPPDCYMIRLGGDEFLVVFYKSSFDNARQFIEHISSKPIVVDNSKNITFSFGLVKYDSNIHTNIDELIHHADKLMYEHKTKKNKRY
jgi:diguanylate cyclase (GGDEF)-like protein/PAS domain S-box-containing protein